MCPPKELQGSPLPRRARQLELPVKARRPAAISDSVLDPDPGVVIVWG